MQIQNPLKEKTLTLQNTTAGKDYLKTTKLKDGPYLYDESEENIEEDEAKEKKAKEPCNGLMMGHQLEEGGQRSQRKDQKQSIEQPQTQESHQEQV